MFNRIFQFGKGHSALTIQVNGNTVPLPLAPIPWAKPQQDNASWLEWRAQLTPLIGRDTEMTALKAWLKETHVLSFKIIHADGGAGKTRLAAELASSVHGKGWQAGMVSLQDFTAADRLTWVGQTLLVLDYPEHAPDAVDKLIRLCLNQIGSQTKGSKLRFLLLCREPSTVQASLNNCGVTLETAAPMALGALAASDQYVLFQAAMKERGQTQKKDLKPAFIDWQSRNALHHEPLFILALALHLSSNAPQVSSGSWLAASDLLQYLVEREAKRWGGIEKAAGIAEGTLANIAAFCTLFDGLPVSKLRELFNLNDAAVRALQKGLPHSQDIYQAMQPDLLGARFLSSWRALRLELGSADKDAVQLLKLCSNNTRLASLLNRWDMQAYDQKARLLLNEKQSLESFLIEICELDNNINSILNNALSVKTKWHGLGLFAVASHTNKKTVADPQNDMNEALSLNLQSIHFSNQGEHAESLRLAIKAMQIYPQRNNGEFLVFDANHAVLLNTLAGRYSNVGDLENALNCSIRAANILTELAKSDITHEPKLANVLNNLAKYYTDFDSLDDALKAARLALEINERLGLKNPKLYDSDLAMSLNTLAIRFSDLGNFDQAIILGERSVAIRKQLVKDITSTHEAALSSSLHNLSVFYAGVKDYAKALEASEQAVQIRERLSQSNPKANEIAFAESLINHAPLQVASGDLFTALANVNKALAIYKKWYDLHPTVHERNYTTAKTVLQAIEAVTKH